ncbi:hypothetical protein SCHPADRAFT_392809 [Schizopora paradoxa]|uniref:RING-type domain-containing protein n=1 Tax=Schizopora paradoxa TaxID=27342 RepID=A0A0H2RN00_9AGAM|nr:hypothetical protein SCHPADRAFT_392809 [Schizopora paradoxa]
MGQRSSRAEVPSWFSRVVQIDKATGKASSLPAIIRFCTACDHGLCLGSKAIEEEHVRQNPSHRQYIFDVNEDNPLIFESIAHCSSSTSNFVQPDDLSFIRTIVDKHVRPSGLIWDFDVGITMPPADDNLRCTSWRSKVNPFSLQYCSRCERVFENVEKLQKHNQAVHFNLTPRQREGRAGNRNSLISSAWCSPFSSSCRSSEATCSAQFVQEFVPPKRFRGTRMSIPVHEEDQRRYYCAVCKRMQYEGHALAVFLHHQYPASTVSRDERNEERNSRWCSRCNVTFRTLNGLNAHSQAADLHNAKTYPAETVVHGPSTVENMSRGSMDSQRRASGYLCTTSNTAASTLPNDVPSGLKKSKRFSSFNRLRLGLGSVFNSRAKDVKEPTGAKVKTSNSTKQSNPSYECPLCLEVHASSSTSLEDEGLSSISCGHVFGTKCIRDALKQDPRCPLCRMQAPEGGEGLRRIFL